ncbi:MAG: PD40 domain-containing protein [Candidatus Zixiibacteriota bacterium]|nr:MAG: PD40 domain-containing protein [candidate division Zixibacteria bacterium]
MKQPVYLHCLTLFLLALLILSGVHLHAMDKMSPVKAGQIEQPTGRIAFIRDKNVWVMDHQGQNQRMVCEVGNANGRLSWAPDGRRIVFTRSGQVNFRSPDNTGGMHKVYDLFIAYLDSADAGKTYWWYRLTDELGGRFPEWLPNGKIIFTKDMHAQEVAAMLPNYQLCIIDPSSGEIEILRKDWQHMTEYLTRPSMNQNGDIAFVHFYDVSGRGPGQPQGIAVLNRDQIMMPLDSIRVLSSRLKGMIGPAWSPDGNWIAYVSNSMTIPGLFISSADLTETYLVFEPPPGTGVSIVAPSFSPDSKWLTFATTDGSIWTCDITGNNARRITQPGLDRAPAWWKGGGN